MEIVDIALLCASVVFALASRVAMKRLVKRRLGKSSDALLEIDFWNATSSDPFARALLLLELLSWAGSIVMTVVLAGRVLA